MTVLFALVGLALAGTAQCLDCCKDSGLFGCPTRLRVFGDGSLATKEAGGFRVSGVWWLDCERGATFDPASTAVVDHAPRPGEVLRLATPRLAVRCFAISCGMPAAACMRESGGEWILSNCADGRVLTATELRVRPRATAAQAAPPSRVVFPGGAAAVNEPRSLPDNLVIDLAEPPAAGCTTSPELERESRRQVDRGDEAAIRGDPARAYDAYRAALAIDRCNAFAWAAVGHLAVESDHPAQAVIALKVATRLAPSHYGAATELGAAWEKLGRLDEAASAYRAALEARPDHLPARQGLERVGR